MHATGWQNIPGRRNFKNIMPSHDKKSPRNLVCHLSRPPLPPIPGTIVGFICIRFREIEHTKLGFGTLIEKKLIALFCSWAQDISEASAVNVWESHIDPWPRYLMKSIMFSTAMLLPKYTHFLPGSDMYTSHLYHHTAPICITILLHQHSVRGRFEHPTRLVCSLSKSKACGVFRARET